jgi:hypothetical protein
MRLRNIIIGLVIVVLLFGFFSGVEGFAYASNPCGKFKSCKTCADAAGCGWCPDLRKCQPMAQDGFPIRTKDITTGDLDISPYTKENLPLLGDCPPSCERTDLGDCMCIAPSVLNSCPPDCYAVYDSSMSGSGSDSGSSIRGSQMSCVCPNASNNSKPGPYERKAFLQRVKAAGESETSKIIGDERIEAALELEVRKDMISALQKSTRIHVCSPHTYVIDSGKC